MTNPTTSSIARLASAAASLRARKSVKSRALEAPPGGGTSSALRLWADSGAEAPAKSRYSRSPAVERRRIRIAPPPIRTTTTIAITIHGVPVDDEADEPLATGAAERQLMNSLGDG